MKKYLLHYVLPILALSLVIYGCAKEEFLAEDTSGERIISSDQSAPIKGQYICVLKEGAVQLGRAAVAAENYLEVRDRMIEAAEEILADNQIFGKEILQAYIKVYQGMAVQLSPDELARLERDERVDYIEQDQRVFVTMGGPPPPDDGGGGGSDSQVTPWGIARVGGPVDGTNAGKAWIIDSGIDASHPDLNVDVASGFNAFTNGPDADLTFDGSGHGTHVAGTVGALDNTIGVVGVAAGATVVPVKVLDRRGSGSYSGVIAGVDWVAIHASNGDAANMSLGGGQSDALDNAVIAAAGTCPFAVAAGNSAIFAGNASPAAAGTDGNVYTVSAMAEGDTWASFSNYGNPPVDVCAPGVSVKSTFNGDGYQTYNGTSMASPHVCGILLLGNVSSNGTVSGDPDGNPDPIAVR